MIHRRPLLAAALAALAFAPVLSAQRPGDDSLIVTTRHVVTVAGRSLRYTARAGLIPIRDNETGDVHAHMFFVAYTLDGAPGQPPRPVTFVWNGGPGSSSSLVHLLGFGPKRLRGGTTLIDNEATWLDRTDLVFVDPVGTGYSRLTRAEYAPEFYQASGDAESVAELIRIYRTRFDAWEAPLFLAGESYGVTRAAGVADVLARRGIRVSGVVLMGLALPLGDLAPAMRTALAVPGFAVAAAVNANTNGRVAADRERAYTTAAEWARTTYAPALARREQLADGERRAIIDRLATLASVDPSVINVKTLELSMEQFALELLRKDGKVVGHYDSRLVGPRDTTQTIYDPTRDPSLTNIISDAAVVRYMRNELGFRSDLPYQGPFGGGYPPPTSFRGDWMSVKWSRVAAAAAKADSSKRDSPAAVDTVTAQPLARAMQRNPGLQVLAACGYYDLVCSVAANAYVAARLPEPQRRNVVAAGYWGGHAIYTDDTARTALKRDAVALIDRATAARTPRNP